MSAIGPELPPHLLAKRKRRQEQEAAQTTAEASGANSSSRSLNAEKRRRVTEPATPTESANTKNEEVHSKSFGAIMPPAPLEERSSHAAEAELSESEDSDDFGPALPTDNLAAGASEIKEASNEQSSTSPAPAAKKLERDEWMMIPPKQDNLAANMDPSKIRARGFQTGKGAKGPAGSKDDDSAWFETPEQKQKRLRDEMMGFTQLASSALQRSSRGARSATDEAATAKRKDEIVRLSTYNKFFNPCANALCRRRVVGLRLWSSISRARVLRLKMTQVNARSTEIKIWQVACE